ncbi:endonuclease/exonuclease/phosphatase family protein [Marinicauda algicola]|nr:endonuclease/exonuclease/phosphatase family protein [Marinicauda algicola]
MSGGLPDWRKAASEDGVEAAAIKAMRAELQALRQALDVQLPAKRAVGRNLLVATWNVRAFGGLTPAWRSGEDDSPKRNWRGLAYIAEIISRFDVVALQEVRGDFKALRELMKTLGPGWQFLMTDVNRGSAGNDERMAYVFDASRVQLSGLAGELTVPDDPRVLEQLGVEPGSQFRQFARSPYAVSFRSGRETFILVTMHVLYGDDYADRTPELKAIAAWMKDWAKDTARWGHSLMLLGDFNIDNKGDVNDEAFRSTGLYVPEELDGAPRTVSFTADGKPPKYYDQIAWFRQNSGFALGMEFITAGGFNFKDLLFQADPKLKPQSMSWRVSDHLPLWCEFAVRS